MKNDSGLAVMKIVVAIGVVILLAIAFWIAFIELYAIGAPPGERPSAALPPIDVVNSIERGLARAPVLGSKANQYLQTAGSVPQKNWLRDAAWWGVLMIGTGLLMLAIKLYLEPTNDETSVMHLKGDTGVALRAKGFRG